MEIKYRKFIFRPGTLIRFLWTDSVASFQFRSSSFSTLQLLSFIVMNGRVYVGMCEDMKYNNAYFGPVSYLDAFGRRDTNTFPAAEDGE